MRIAESVRALTPYTPGEQPKDRSVIKLNTNENPYLPSPLVEKVLASFDLDRLRRYPDPVFTELREKCDWQNLKNGGYKVVGPNGNYITFPLTGFINCTGEFLNANKFGDYWTSTTDGTDEAYRVAFNEKNIIIALHPKCYARAIRLVK